MRVACVALLAACTSGAVSSYGDRYSLTPRNKGESCRANSKERCLNSELRTDQFQPHWLSEERHNAEFGLYCPQGASAVCSERLDDNRVCFDHDDCKSRMCFQKAHEGGKLKRCWGFESVPEGQPCPRVDLLPEHHPCEKGFRCVSVNNADKLCFKYGEEDEACTVTNRYDTAGRRTTTHTCEPENELLHCVVAEADRPSSTLVNYTAKGICREIEERDEFESCARDPVTGHVPKCQYDQYCLPACESADDVAMQGLCKRATDTCHDQGSCDDPCVSHAGCGPGLWCNWGVKANDASFASRDITKRAITGLCLPMFSVAAGDADVVSDSVFCEWPLSMDPVSRLCVAEPMLGKACTNDTTCQAGHLGQVRPSPLYCRHAAAGAAGTCEDFITSDCEDRWYNYVKYALGATKGEYLEMTRSCWADDACFSLRVMYKQMKEAGERLMCCLMRDSAHEHGDYAWLPPLPYSKQAGKVGWQWVDTSSSNEGAICTPYGISAVTIAILCVIFGFLFFIMVFVLVKECVLYAHTSTPTPAPPPLTSANTQCKHIAINKETRVQPTQLNPTQPLQVQAGAERRGRGGWWIQGGMCLTFLFLFYLFVVSTHTTV